MTEQNPQPEPQQQQQQQAQPQPQQQQPQPQPQAQPEPGNAYEGIIQQQQEQINALLEQTKSLNAQIVSMVNNGAQFNQQTQPQPQPMPQPQQQYQPFSQPAYNPMSLANDGHDWSLEALAKEIGRKDD